MAEVKIDFGKHKKGSPKLARFIAQTPKNLSRSFHKAGARIQRQIKINIDGPGFTRNPERNSPYPGVLYGAMRNSVSSVQERRLGDLRQLIGPGGYSLKYAGVQDENRPFMSPSFRQVERKVREDVRGTVMKPLRGR